MEGTRKERPPLSIEYAHLEKSRKYSDLADVIENRSRNTVDTLTFNTASFFSTFTVKTLMNPLHRVRTIMQCWKESFPSETTRPSIREIVACKLIRYQAKSRNSRTTERKYPEFHAAKCFSDHRFLPANRWLLGYLRKYPQRTSAIPFH